LLHPKNWIRFQSVLSFFHSNVTSLNSTALRNSMDATSAELLEQFMHKTGKTRAEAEALILEKTQKFAGLLSNEAALFLLAKEAGIETDTMPVHHETISIGQLEIGQTNIDVACTAKRIFPVKEFANKTKPGTGRRCAIQLADSTGEIWMTLWHDHTKLLAQIPTGTPLRITNASVTEFNAQKQLNFTGKSKFETLTDAKLLQQLPAVSIQYTEPSAVETGQWGITTRGIVSKLYPIKTFQNDRGSGEYAAFEIKDDSAILRCVAWNSAVRELEDITENMRIQIENAYTRENRNGETELHLGENTRIVRLKK